MLPSFLNNFSPEIKVFILSMLPMSETLVSLPMALNYYHLPFWEAFLLSIIGNTIPAVLIIFYLGPVSIYLSQKSHLLKKFFDWLFTRTRRKFNHHYDEYGLLGLALFMAIPFPLTGVWTAAAAAWLFDLPKIKSVLYIFLGVLMAGVVVAAMNFGLAKVF